jgi:hypothetical protein
MRSGAAGMDAAATPGTSGEGASCCSSASRRHAPYSAPCSDAACSAMVPSAPTVTV